MHRPRTGAATLSALAGLFLFFLTVASCSGGGDPLSRAERSFAQLSKTGDFRVQAGYLLVRAPEARDYFGISSDFSRDTDDLVLGIDLSDFMQAGFVPEDLKTTDLAPAFSVYDLPTSSIVLSLDVSAIPFRFDTYRDDSGKPLASPSPLSVFSEFLKSDPLTLRYDDASRFYLLSPGAGILIAWTTDDKKGPKGQILFALDPDPFIHAGLDVAKLKKWKQLDFNLPEADGKARLVHKLVLVQDLS